MNHENFDITKFRIGDFIKIEDPNSSVIASRFKGYGRVSAIRANDNNLQLITVNDYSTASWERYTELRKKHLDIYNIKMFLISEEQYNREITERLAEAKAKLEKYVSLVREFYPGRIVLSEYNGVMNIFFLFKEETVESEYDMTIQVKNLVYRIEFDYKAEAKRIKASRFKATRQEINANYSHSHCESDGLYGWTKHVCFGDTVISDAYNNIKLGYSEYHFELFAHQLLEYVKFESSEGGPYNYMRSIYESENNSIDYDEPYWRRKLLSVGYEPKFGMNSAAGNTYFTVDQQELSRFMISEPSLYNELLDANLIGMMSNGNYSGRVGITEETDNLARFKNAESLDVSDGFNRINLTREVDEAILGEFNNPDYMYVHKPMLDRICLFYQREFKKYIINEQVNDCEREEV